MGSSVSYWTFLDLSFLITLNIKMVNKGLLWKLMRYHMSNTRYGVWHMLFLLLALFDLFYAHRLLSLSPFPVTNMLIYSCNCWFISFIGVLSYSWPQGKNNQTGRAKNQAGFLQIWVITVPLSKCKELFLILPVTSTLSSLFYFPMPYGTQKWNSYGTKESWHKQFQNLRL